MLVTLCKDIERHTAAYLNTDCVFPCSRRNGAPAATSAPSRARTAPALTQSSGGDCRATNYLRSKYRCILVTMDEGWYLSKYPAAAHSACALIQRGELRSHFDLLFVQQLPTHVHRATFFAVDYGRVVVTTTPQLPGRRPLGLCFYIARRSPTSLRPIICTTTTHPCPPECIFCHGLLPGSWVAALF